MSAPLHLSAVAFFFCAGVGAFAAGCATSGGDVPSSSSSLSSSSSSSAAALESAPGHGHGGAVDWQPWAPETFARAKAEKRLLLVTVVTEWCHWCHVMDEKTWGDPVVAALMSERFIPIRVDADARPDLAERYADWGWPALAVLTPDAKPVMEWKGYQEARRFEGELRAYVADLDAGRPLARKAVVVAEITSPLSEVRDFTRAQLNGFYDGVAEKGDAPGGAPGGWGKRQKYPLWGPIEAGLFAHTLSAAADETARAARIAEVKTTLDGELQLIDPVDGGMYQYSLKRRWDAPHYEKLAEIQGTAMESLSDAGVVLGEGRYLQGAREIARYVMTFLRRDDGAFYANQDADVGTRGDVEKVIGIDWYGLPTRTERAARGEPFIDRHVYASHNGRIIGGLARLGAATGDASYVAAAAASADVILAKHRVGDGFSHDEGSDDDGTLYLADQFAMGGAFVRLYEATGDNRWRQEAARTARFIVSRFSAEAGGYYAHTEVPGAVGVFAERRTPYKANGEAARFILAIGRLEEDAALTASAEKALQAFANPELVKVEYRAVGEMLWALESQLHEPLHFAVVVGVDGVVDDTARALLAAANRLPTVHRVVDVQPAGKKYPDLGQSILYVCGSTFCSPPIKDPATVAKKAERYLR